MAKQQTITINGARYDALTGKRLEDEAVQAPKNTTLPGHKHGATAHALHGQKTQKSQTLSRRHVAVPEHNAHSLRKKTSPVHYAKSEMVTRFAASAPQNTHRPPVISDIGPVIYPKAVAAAQRKQPHHTQAVHKVAHQAVRTQVRHQPAHTAAPHTEPTNKEVKNHAIQQALEKSVTPKGQHKLTKHHHKFLIIGLTSLALVLLVGYFTYVNMPSLSVRVAAAQAGIAANYPSYQPAGYALRGPVSFEDGQVTMKFTANNATQNFTLSQSRSTWDSSALLDNYVQQASNGKYETYQDSGLTIYIFNTSAAWVNAGILHTISGDVQLPSDAIRHIATSM
jgi:hypothetical protein